MRVIARPLALCALLLAPAPAWATWPQDASLPLYAFADSVVVGVRANSAPSSDSGFLLVSLDSMAVNNVVRAQRFDAQGHATWGPSGVLLATGGGPWGFSAAPTIASDGAGGAYFGYSNWVADTLCGFVAHVLKTGTIAWTTPVATGLALNNQYVRGVVDAGSAGVVVVWGDFRSGDFDIYAQRMSAAGVPQWVNGGVLVAGGPGNQDVNADAFARTSSGRNCAAWTDAATGLDRVQEWDDSGTMLWPANGALVSPTLLAQAGLQGAPRIVVEDAGAVWLQWTDTRNGPGRERTYGQRILSDGTRVWGDGLMISRQRTLGGPKPVLVPGTGTWFTWAEIDSTTSLRNARAGFFDGSGIPSTPTEGLLISDGTQGNMAVRAHPDNAGGITSVLYNFNLDRRIKGQHVSFGLQTLAHPPLVSTNVYLGILTSSSDLSGGLVTAWLNGAGTRTLVARVTASGCLGGEPPVLESVADVPNDEGGVVQLCWQRACHDTTFTTLYRVLRRPSGSGAAWTEVATYDAIGLAMNCYQAPTDADSSGAGPADYEWRIVWDHPVAGTDSSNVLTGHSKDNLAPGPVGKVTVVFHPGASVRPASASPQRAEFGPYNTVSWTASPSSDVAGIRVYRESWPGFTPSPANIVADLPASQLTVNDGASHAYYYKVVAYDHVGNMAPSAGAVSGGSDVVSVFSTDFESGVPAQITAPGSVLSGTQGYAGLGPPGNQFGATFLRYTSVPLFDTRLVLRNLAPHTGVSVGFLLGIIDSWDGTELFQVRVDGALLFNHWFQLALGDSSDYIAPPGVLLSRGHDLGFSGCCYYDRDRAYDLSADPIFQNIPHTADSLVVVWSISAVSGPAADQWQGGDDESWAIDNVRVTLTTPIAGVPGAGDPPSRLELAGAQPNPSRDGRLSIHFALATSGPARLELFDVAGRRLAARDVGGMGVGRHAVDLGAGLDLDAGLYLVRLTQGATRRTARAIVMR